MWQYTVHAEEKGDQSKSPRAKRLKGRHKEETTSETEKAETRPGHPLQNTGLQSQKAKIIRQDRI